MKSWLPWAIALALLAYVAADAIRTHPDPSAPFQAAIDSLTARGDSLASRNEALAASVVLSAAREDSARQTALRADSLGRARIAQATRRTQEATNALRASLSEAQAVQLAAIEAGWAEIVMAKDELLASANALVATYQAGIEARDLLIAGLRDELANEVAIGSQLTDANAALRDEIARQNTRTWLERAGFVVTLGVLLLR